MATMIICDICGRPIRGAYKRLSVESVANAFGGFSATDFCEDVCKECCDKICSDIDRLREPREKEGVNCEQSSV